MRWIYVSAVLLTAVLIAGCTPSAGSGGLSGSGESSEITAETGPQITLQEARQFQNQVLWDIGEYVPAEHLRGEPAVPIERMSAMKCDWAKEPVFSSKGSGVFLPGGYNIEILPETDSEMILNLVFEEYQRQGWETISEGGGLDRELVLNSPEGYTFYVRFYNWDLDDRKFVISSFSPCIEAPDDFDIFTKY